MKKKNIALLSTGVLATLSVGVLGFVGNYFYNLALNPETSKDIIWGKTEESEGTNGQVVNKDVNWLTSNSNFSDEYITSFDNLKLHGYKILNENPTNKWSITVHGYTCKGSDMIPYAKNFYDMGIMF